MKLKTLLVMAVAAIGALALSVPAFAASSSNGGIPSIDSQLGQLKAAGKAAKSRANSSSKHNTRVNTDLKRLGENVAALRKGQDQTNFTLGAVTAQAVSALSSLQAGLVTVAAATTNFKYGVVQVGTIAGPTSGLGGVGPTHFFATPPIYNTGEQSTVTFPIPDVTATVTSAGGNVLAASPSLRLNAAVRSVNPDSGSVVCKMLVQRNDGSINSGGTVASWATWIQGSTNGIFVDMPQSRISPQNGNTSFPYALVATEDNVLDLADPKYMASLISIAGKAPSPSRPNSTNGATGTLSCLVS